jgi:RIO-like serine/threonine protein kinase
MDNMDVEILKVIYEKSHNSLIAPLFLIEKFRLSDEEIGDRLEIMDEDGYVKVAKGTYAPGMSLLNGINYVGIAAKGRQILRDKKLI